MSRNGLSEHHNSKDPPPGTNFPTSRRSSLAAQVSRHYPMTADARPMQCVLLTTSLKFRYVY